MSVNNATSAPWLGASAVDPATAARSYAWWTRLSIFAAAVFVLLVPALWNGVALVFPDTGGYLLRPFEGTLEIGRSALYGAFLAVGAAFDFWPTIVVQAAATAWLVMLTLRAHQQERFTPATVLGLAVTTSLPWFAGQLMPDIFLPIAMLARYLLAFCREQLRSVEVIGLVAAIAFAIASHMAIFAVTVAVLLSLVALRALTPRLLGKRPRIATPIAAVGIGMALAIAPNFAMTGVAAFTPGGASFLFNRLNKDGIVTRYLDEKCPDSALRLCQYRHELPTDDDWLWQDSSPLQKLGGWADFEPEAKHIIFETLQRYPSAHIASALRSTFEQFARLNTGEGLHPYDTGHVESVMSQHAPHSLARYRASVQHRDGFDFSAINRLHVPIAVMAIATIPLLLLMLRWRGRPSAAYFW
jgi:hypothetical protein